MPAENRDFNMRFYQLDKGTTSVSIRARLESIQLDITSRLCARCVVESASQLGSSSVCRAIAARSMTGPKSPPAFCTSLLRWKVESADSK